MIQMEALESELNEVEMVEAKPATTRNHYGDYMGIWSQFAEPR